MQTRSLGELQQAGDSCPVPSSPPTCMPACATSRRQARPRRCRCTVSSRLLPGLLELSAAPAAAATPVIASMAPNRTKSAGSLQGWRGRQGSRQAGRRGRISVRHTHHPSMCARKGCFSSLCPFRLSMAGQPCPPACVPALQLTEWPAGTACARRARRRAKHRWPTGRSAPRRRRGGPSAAAQSCPPGSRPGLQAQPAGGGAAGATVGGWWLASCNGTNPAVAVPATSPRHHYGSQHRSAHARTWGGHRPRAGGLVLLRGIRHCLVHLPYHVPGILRAPHRPGRQQHAPSG